MKLFTLSFLLISIMMPFPVKAEFKQSRAERSNRERVIDGVEVQAADGASTARITVDLGDFKNYCGASLVSPLKQKDGSIAWRPSIPGARWAITAAHCILGPNSTAVSADKISLVAGRLNENIEDEGEKRHIWAAVMHENYKQLSHAISNDVALLYLDPPSKDESLKRKSIALPRIGERWLSNTPSLSVYVQGWGNTEPEDKPSNRLLEAQVPLVEWDTCRKEYDKIGFRDQIEPNMLCAGFKYGGADSCRGDSGGPLIFRPKNGKGSNVKVHFSHPLLLGVVSWSEGCGRQDLYGVYASVSQFVGWFDTKVIEFFGCRSLHHERDVTECLEEYHFEISTALFSDVAQID